MMKENVSQGSRKILNVPVDIPPFGGLVIRVRCGRLDVPVRAFTTGQLASILGRLPQTIQTWERKGIIPPPANRIRKRGRWRVYTQDEVQVILDAYHESHAGEAFHLRATRFPQLVKSGFKQLLHGVDHARVV